MKFNINNNERIYSKQYTVLDTYIYNKTIFQKEGNYNTKFKINILDGRAECVREGGVNIGR